MAGLLYGEIIYAGTNEDNLNTNVNLIYTGLHIYDNTNNKVDKEILCRNHHIAPLELRQEIHLLLYMHKQTYKKNVLKKKKRRTRLHQAPVFFTVPIIYILPVNIFDRAILI